MDTEINKVFQVGANCSVQVSNIQGTTRIEGWDKAEVQVRAWKHSGGRDADEMTEVEIYQEGDEVIVRTKVKPQEWLSWLGMKHPAAVDYLINAPYQCRVSTPMVSGATTVKGIHNGLKLKSVSGDSSVEDIAGEVLLDTVSGNVNGYQVSGDIKAKTVSGDINLRASELKTLRGNTVSGDLRIETSLADQGEYDLGSVSGDLRLDVPPQTRCTVTLSTVSGDLRANLPHDIIEKKRTSKRYNINGGGVLVTMHSVSGDGKISAREGQTASAEPSVSSEAAAQPSADDDKPLNRMQILKMIEAGELTVEDGLARLQAISRE
jgi:hypothetical protein